jgi:hypothetical protein
MSINQLIRASLHENQLESLSPLEKKLLIGGIAWLAEREGLENLAPSHVLDEFSAITAWRDQKYDKALF